MPKKHARADGESTQGLILQAARRQLCEAGYARLNVRDIARDAGVNHALIGYHFQGKAQLVLAVLDDANKRLLERQTRMYGETTTASKKWQQACDFYEEDLRSGFVRLLMELMAASFHDEALRREFTPRLLAWVQLVETAVADFVQDASLELPVSARAISAWISWFWIGMEASMALGISEKDGHHREALAAVATLLRRVEAVGRKKPSKNGLAAAPKRPTGGAPKRPTPESQKQPAPWSRSANRSAPTKVAQPTIATQRSKQSTG